MIADHKSDTAKVNKILVTQEYKVIQLSTVPEIEAWLQQADQNQTESAELILIDLLPNQNQGPALVRRLQSSLYTTTIPIIFLTDSDSVSTQVACLHAGASDYITKPFTTSELISRVAVQLQLKQQTDRMAAPQPLITPARLLSAINTISHQAAQHFHVEQMLNEVVSKVANTFHCDSCTIYLFSKESEQLILSASSIQQQKSNSTPAIIDVVSNQGQSFVWGTETAVPIKLNNNLIGVIHLIKTRLSIANPEVVVQAVEILATQLSTAITNADLFQNIRQHNLELNQIAEENGRLLQAEQLQRQQAEQLHNMSQMISSSLEIGQVLVATIESVETMIQVERGSIFLLNKQKNRLSFIGTLQQDDRKLANYTIPADQGIVGQVVQSGQSLIVNDAQAHPLFSHSIDTLTGQFTRALLCVPLIARAKVIGAIELLNKERVEFNERDLNLVESAAASIAIALDNAQLYQAQKALTQKIATSQEQLLQSEKMAATGRLAASLAHEINNPLQAIHSCLQLAVHFDLPDDKQDEYLNMAHEEVERLIDIVTRILDFSRPSPAKIAPTDINKIVHQVLGLTQKHTIHGKWDITQSLATDLPQIEVIPDQIAQIFLNIVLNAFDAMPKGGLLHIKTHHQGNEIEISFHDNGVGMTTDIQEQIFEPFFSTKQESPGLGLTISYGIIDRHGGSIRMSSQPHKGSTFTVSLPIPAPSLHHKATHVR